MKFLPHGDLDLSGASVCAVDPVPHVDSGFLGLMTQIDDGLTWNLVAFGGLGRAGGLVWLILERGKPVGVILSHNMLLQLTFARLSVLSGHNQKP